MVLTFIVLIVLVVLVDRRVALKHPLGFDPSTSLFLQEQDPHLPELEFLGLLWLPRRTGLLVWSYPSPRLIASISLQVPSTRASNARTADGLMNCSKWRSVCWPVWLRWPNQERNIRRSSQVLWDMQAFRPATRLHFLSRKAGFPLDHTFARKPLDRLSCIPCLNHFVFKLSE